MNNDDQIMENSELNDKPYPLNWESLFQHQDFFNHFFSCYFPFHEADLLFFQHKIILGAPGGIPYSFGYSDTNYGLIFNKNNIWNQRTFSTFYREPQIIYAGNSIDEYSFELKLKQLPYNINNEIESKINLESNQLIEQYRYISNEEGLRDESLYENLGNELKDIRLFYSRLKSQIDFDSEIIFNIINSNNQDYFCNEIFCAFLLNKIFADIDDFKIEKFYNNI